MIEPKRAPVRPRGLPLQSTTPLLLDEEINSLVESGGRGNIAILGAIGSGKTTALAHLAAVLPRSVLDKHVTLLDEPAHGQLVDNPAHLVVYTSGRIFPDLRHVAAYKLSLWTEDDLIEYLLSVYRSRCASVMTRVGANDRLLLGGSPELCRIALDRLAGDVSLPDVRHALHHHLQDHLTDTDLLERARSACLNVQVTPGLSLADAVTGIAKPGFAESLLRVLRHPPMQRMLAAERISADLHREAGCDYLAKRLPRDLVEAVGHLIQMTQASRALEHLHSLLAGPPWSHAMAASLLHAAGASARLEGLRPKQLAGAYLEGISWPGRCLRDANLAECDLSRADLRASYMARADLRKSCLRQSCLHGADWFYIIAGEADIRDADLTGIFAARGQFNDATLENSDLSRGSFRDSSFVGANLSRASFRAANLTQALLQDAELEQADFSEANLTRADLEGHCLRKARWLGACFHRAIMNRCDLEFMTLPDADFRGASLQGALFTGSTMHRANFQEALLQNAKMADIDWEGADLRDADLRGASFHMGSTRSGLVGSTIPCEGSKTGFYTDDYDEQSYKAPEEIRKANLCDADLRGAILEGVDFYLVDLRGARYDKKDAKYLRRCGAILEARV